MSPGMKSHFGKPSGKTKEEVYGWRIIDEPGEFAWVPKEQLNIDPDYQRNVHFSRKIQAIQQEWSWRAALVLGVERRPDGSLWVFDGQHRKFVADKRVTITHLPCLIFDTEGKEEGAKAFELVNDHRGAIKSRDLFRAKVCSNDPTALEIRNFIEGFGYKIGSASKSTIDCIASICNCWKRNERIAKEAFSLCAKLCQGENFHSEIFKGLFYLIHHCERYEVAGPTDPRIFKRLRDAGTIGCLKSIAESRAAIGKGGEKVMGHALLKICNKRNSNPIPAIF